MENKTVLVIEGNELNMKLVRSMLQLQHYQVLEAGDAETGIQIAREKLPDLSQNHLAAWRHVWTTVVILIIILASQMRNQFFSFQVPQRIFKLF